MSTEAPYARACGSRRRRSPVPHFRPLDECLGGREDHVVDDRAAGQLARAKIGGPAPTHGLRRPGKLRPKVDQPLLDGGGVGLGRLTGGQPLLPALVLLPQALLLLPKLLLDILAERSGWDGLEDLDGGQLERRRRRDGPADLLRRGRPSLLRGARRLRRSLGLLPLPLRRLASRFGGLLLLFFSPRPV